jgi:hypothetical protein
MRDKGDIMHGTKEIIKEAEALPVEERAKVIDSLLRTLNHPNAEVDRKWIEVVKHRLAELRSGRVKPVPGQQVFTQVRERFEK